MLNEISHRSFDKASQSDQHASQAEMMAMPTAGGEVDPDDEPSQKVNAKLASSRKLNQSSSANIKPRKASKRSVKKAGPASKPASASMQDKPEHENILNEQA